MTYETIYFKVLLTNGQTLYLKNDLSHRERVGKSNMTLELNAPHPIDSDRAAKHRQAYNRVSKHYMPFGGFIVWDYVFICNFGRFICLYNRKDQSWDYISDSIDA